MTQKTELRFYPIVEEGTKKNLIRYSDCIVLVEENLENPDDSIFAIGESRCGVKENYNKKTGKTIAEGRAHSVDCKYTDIFKLSDALLMETYGDGPIKDGVIQPQSSVTGPMSLKPIPYGIVNRLRSLLSPKAS